MIGRIVKIEEISEGRVLVSIQTTTDDSKGLTLGSSVAFPVGEIPTPEKARRGRPPNIKPIEAQKDAPCQD